MFVLHDRPQVCVIFRHVVCGDSVTFRLSVSASHIQSQVKSRRQISGIYASGCGLDWSSLS